MSCDCFKEREVVTRKPHRCAYCEGVIPKGSFSLRESGICDREPFARYVCALCKPYINGFWNWCDGEAAESIPATFHDYLEKEGLLSEWEEAGRNE